MSGGRNRRKTGAPTENKMASMLDKLDLFENFQAEILPQLRKMLKDGKQASEIIQWAKAYAAARMVTAALTEEDSGKAITAAKDILDRADGKAKERVEHEHKLSKLKDEELDAVLLSGYDGVAGEDSAEH